MTGKQNSLIKNGITPGTTIHVGRIAGQVLRESLSQRIQPASQHYAAATA